MFMGKSEAEIAHIALETLEGHQRAIIAHLTVEVGAMTHFLTLKYRAGAIFEVHFLPIKDVSEAL